MIRYHPELDKLVIRFDGNWEPVTSDQKKK